MTRARPASRPGPESRARLESLGDGRFRVSGVLDASTATEVLEQSESRFEQAAQIDVDLGGVADSDSAGLALLIEWLRIARQSNKPIHFANVPAQIQALARISEVEDLICEASDCGPAEDAARQSKELERKKEPVG